MCNPSSVHATTAYASSLTQHFMKPNQPAAELRRLLVSSSASLPLAWNVPYACTTCLSLHPGCCYIPWLPLFAWACSVPCQCGLAGSVHLSSHLSTVQIRLLLCIGSDWCVLVDDQHALKCHRPLMRLKRSMGRYGGCSRAVMIECRTAHALRAVLLRRCFFCLPELTH